MKSLIFPKMIYKNSRILKSSKITPLNRAVKNNSIDIVNLILPKGADVNTKDLIYSFITKIQNQ